MGNNQGFTENNFLKKTLKGKYNLVYSERNPNSGKPFVQVLNAIQPISARLYNALKALFVESGEYRELPNPITLNNGTYNQIAYPKMSRALPMPKFRGISTASTTNVWGDAGTALSDNDIAIITDLQIRVHEMEQMLAGNFNSTQHKDISSV